VTDHYEQIEGAYRTKQIVIACKGSQCSDSIYAYVFPTQPYKIYVCGAFWASNLSGTDSRSGTLVHEMSHFDIVAGTDDVVYGQQGAMQLAIRDEDTAITNADTHEYFAENQPDLPM
jgi:peptidyl-Lys metalloendopeptidase